MDYLLRHALTSDDIDFLNETTMRFDIVNTEGPKPGEYDSGWCDMATGRRIVHPKDRAVFRHVSEAEYTYLQLRYRDRLNELTEGLAAIYNIVQTF